VGAEFAEQLETVVQRERTDGDAVEGCSCDCVRFGVLFVVEEVVVVSLTSP